MQNRMKRALSWLLVFTMMFSMMATVAFATDVIVIESKIKVSDTQSSISVESGTVTATASGWSSSKTNTISVYNTGSTKAQIIFNYTASGDVKDGTITVGGTSTSVLDGKVDTVLEPNTSYTLSFANTKKSLKTSTATLTLSGFQHIAVVDGATLNISHNSYGSVMVDGNAVADGGSATIGEEATMVATPVSGASFVAWVDKDSNYIISQQATYTLKPSAASMNVWAVFTKADQAPYYKVGTTLYTSFASAKAAAVSGSDKTIVLISDGTFTEGAIEIPAGVSLLLPYDEAEILRGKPTEWSLDKYVIGGSNFPDTPEHSIIEAKTYGSVVDKEFRRLTLAEGTSITVNGSLEVSGQTHPLAKGQLGNYALLQMGSNTSIIVGSTGKLYAWGYIRGSGTVTVESSGEVYEHFDCLDYPPGGAGGLDPMNTAGVFGMTNYTFNSVEVPTTYKAGAKLKVYLVMTGYSIGTNAFVREFIGSDSNAVMNLKDGTITKTYSDGRQGFEIAGDTEFNKFYIRITLKVLGVTAVDYTVDSSTTSGLPLSHSWDITVTDGATVTLNGSLLMYAGSTLAVENGSKIVVPSGVKLSLLDPTSDPSGVTSDAMIDLNGEIETSGGFYTSTGEDATTGEIDLPVVKSSNGTGKVTVNAVGTETTFNVRASGDNYAAVNITPAKLQNSDKSLLETAKGGANTYTYTVDKWVCTTHIDSDPVDGTCDVCKTVLCAHETMNTVVTDPTCTDKGYTTHTCSACGYSYKDTPVSALGHDFTGNWINTDPDSHWKKCSRCDEIDQSAAHGYDNACDASCDTCGYTRTASDHVYDNDCDTTCNVCGAVREVAGHSYGNPTFAWGDNYSCTATFTCTSCQHPEVVSCAVTQTTTDPKCGVAGETVYTATATFNGKEYINVDEETVEVPALEHDWDEGEETTPASCETEGVKTFTCQRTGCGTTKTEPIPATGHSWKIADVDKPISWIPKENGGYDCQVSGTCGVCSETTTVTSTTVTGTVSKDATCISAGETTYTAVFAEADNVWISGPLSTKFTDIKELGHDYTSEVTTQPTCTAVGIKTYTCQRTDCGHTYTEVVDALGHDPVNHESKAPTCTEIGWDAYQTCSRCDYTTYAEKAATGHSYEAVVTAPTCTEAGYTTYTCACGDSYVADQVDANGHSYESIVTEPTCTDEGYTTYTCACGDSYVADKVDANGHSYEAVVTAPTCTEEGYTTYTCHCGDSYTDDEVAATGHSHVGTVTKQPTCTEKGVETFKCSACGDSYTKEVPAKGHSWTVGAADWSGDKEKGYSCSVTRTCFCNAFETAEAIKIETAVTREPTLNALGKTTYTAVFREDQAWAYAVRTLDDIPMLPAEAKIGEIRYATLEDAIQAVNEGETIVLLSAVSVEGDKTWDLSGKSLEIPSFEGNYGVVVKGSLTIAGGTFQMTGPFGIGVPSGGALTVNGGCFNAGNGNDYMIGNWGTTVINGGEFNGWYCCVNNFAGTTQITGGSFKVAGPAQEIEGVTYEPWEILGDTGISISGGSFGNEPYEGDLAEGYCPWLTEGLYVVKAHSFTEEVNGTRVDATCKETGSVTMKCANCDETQTETLEINPDAHNATTVPGKAATCTEAGLTDGSKCEICEKTLTEQKTIPALGHTEETIPGKAATCAETGLTDGKKCTVCGETTVAQEEIPVLGHTPSDAVIENEVAATMDKAGTYDSVVYCSVESCKIEISRTTVTVKSAKIGETEYATLVDALADAAEGATITLLANIDGDITVFQVVTINKNGFTANITAGEGYNATEAEGIVTITAGCVHANLKHVEAVEATCVAEGNKEYWHCEACGKYYSDEACTTEYEANAWIIPKSETHTPGEAVVENMVESTATAVGSYDSVIYCTVCEKEYSRENKPALLNPFTGATMSLNDSFALNFILDPTTLTGTNNYAVITRTYVDGRKDDILRIDQSNWVPHNDTHKLKFAYPNIAAKEMTDMLYVVIYNSNDEVISEVYSESVQTFAMRAINSLTNKQNPSNRDKLQRTMFVDMLNYGAAAQNYFYRDENKQPIYSEDQLANALLEDKHQALASQSIAKENKQDKGPGGYVSSALILENTIQMKFRFQKAIVTSDMYAVITYTHHGGTKYEKTVMGTEFVSDGTRWAINAEGMAIADGSQLITCRIYKENGEEVTYAVDTMNSYLTRAVEGSTEELYPKTLLFTRSAYAFFHA